MDEHKAQVGVREVQGVYAIELGAKKTPLLLVVKSPNSVLCRSNRRYVAGQTVLLYNA